MDPRSVKIIKTALIVCYDRGIQSEWKSCQSQFLKTTSALSQD